MFKVALRTGHPTGIYRRAGIEFSASAPTRLEEVPEAVARDPWLLVSEDNSPAEAPVVDMTDALKSEILRLGETNEQLTGELAQTRERVAELEKRFQGACEINAALEGELAAKGAETVLSNGVIATANDDLAAANAKIADLTAKLTKKSKAAAPASD